MDTFPKGIQYALEKLGSRNLALKEQQYQILKAKDTRALGTSLLIIPELRVLVLTKRYVGSGNEIDLLTNTRNVQKLKTGIYQSKFILTISYRCRNIMSKNYLVPTNVIASLNPRPLLSIF